MCFGRSCWSNDLYEITKQANFQEGVENSILEYRFMVGKNMNHFTLSRIFQGKRVRYYNGSKEKLSDQNASDRTIFVDLRNDFIYGVYAY